MFVETEVVADGDQWSVTDDLAVRPEHNMNASAKIQVFIARSTNDRMSPNHGSFILENTRMIVDHASPFVLVGINTDATVTNSDGDNRIKCCRCICFE